MLGYLVDRTVLVLINSGRAEGTFEGLSIPGADWIQISDGHQIHSDGIAASVHDPASGRVTVPAQTALIWVRR